MIVYHYTSLDAYDDILRTREFKPSFFSIALDARYGEGWYFTDLNPSESDEVLYQLWGRPEPSKVLRFLAFDIDPALLQWKRPHVYRLPLESIPEGVLRLGWVAIGGRLIRFLRGGERITSFHKQESDYYDKLGKFLLGGLLLLAVIGVLSALFGRGKAS